MPFESLLKLAETLKERISVHNPALSASETLTRYALIDPLLRELGWDTSDPSAVIPEYKTQQGGKADYALLSADKPAMIVEAKSLGTDLGAGVIKQVLEYAWWDEKIIHFAVTNGARWAIYERNSPKPIVAFDLSKDPLAEACLKALALWRPSVEGGSVAAGQPSVIEPNPVVIIPTPLPVPPGDWHPLAEINPTNRTPVELLFPDNTPSELTKWVALLPGVVRWLSSNGQLTKTHCPIKKSERAKRYIVHTTSVHSDGKNFNNPIKENDFYLEGKYQSGENHVEDAVTVIERVGQAPSQFRIRFRD